MVNTLNFLLSGRVLKMIILDDKTYVIQYYIYSIVYLKSLPDFIY